MSFQLQRQIRQNAEDVKDYVSDLYDWEKSMSKKQGTNKTASSADTKPDYPVRGNANYKPIEDKQKENLPNKDSKELIRDINSIPNYYKAWDAYSAKIDHELDANDDTSGVEKEIQAPNPQDMMKRTSGAAKNTKLVVKGGRSAAPEVESLKEKGNLYFKTVEYDKALQAYTEAIDTALVQLAPKELLTALYSNRAMTYMRLNEYMKVENDCTKALEQSPQHIKSLVRRSKARRRLLNLKEALKDIQMADKTQPNDKDIIEELSMVESKIKSIKEEKMRRMVLPFINPGKPKIRIEILDSIQTGDQNKVNNQAKKESITPKANLDKPREQTSTASQSEISTKKSDIVQLNNEPAKPYVPAEEPGEFMHLKNVEGKPLTGDENTNQQNSVQSKEVEQIKAPLSVEEDEEQKVHFRIDLNTANTRPTAPLSLQQSLKERPKKSILKKSVSFTAPVVEPASSNEKEDNIKPVKNKQMSTEQIVSRSIKELQRSISEGPSNKTAEQPVNSSEFMNTWKYIKNNEETAGKYLSNIEISSLPAIFKEGLDMDVFSELLTVASKLISKNLELGKEMLITLKTMKRFEIFSKSLLKSEKKDVMSLLNSLKERKMLTEVEYGNLTKAYKL